MSNRIDSDAQRDASVTRRTIQVHLRLLPPEVDLLRALARDRGQTLSGAVRYLLRKECRGRKEQSI